MDSGGAFTTRLMQQEPIPDPESKTKQTVAAETTSSTSTTSNALPAATASISKPVADARAAPSATSSSAPALAPQAQTMPKEESAEWLNTMIKQLWPYINEFAKTLMTDTIQPMVNELLPAIAAPLEFQKTSLGNVPFRVKSVMVHEKRQDSMLLDLDIDYQGNPEISISLLHGTVNGGVEKLHISGRLCVLLKPLVNIIPLIGAVQAAFVNPPNLELEYSGIADIADSMLFKNAVNNTILQVISSMMVYPKSFSFILSSNVDYFDCFHQPEGVLRIGVAEAKGFQSEGMLFRSSPDVYITVRLGNETFQTETSNGTSMPHFNASKDMLLYDNRQEIMVTIYDNNIGRDTKYGEVCLPIREVLATGDKWVTVKDDEGKEGPQARITAKLLGLEANMALEGQNEAGKNTVLLVVLVDKADGIAKDAKPRVKITVGEQVQETAAFAEGEGIDITKPVYHCHHLFMLPSAKGVVVNMEILSGTTKLGSVAVNLDGCLTAPNLTLANNFPVEGSSEKGAILRAMCKLLYFKS